MKPVHFARSVMLVSLVASLGGVGGCVGPSDGNGTTVQHISVPNEPLPIVQLVLGQYDGNELTFRTLQPQEIEDASNGLGDGVVVEALSSIPSSACTSCTGNSYVAFSNVNATASWSSRSNGADVAGYTAWSANTANCGAVPTSGLCAQIRARNLYPASQLERVYVDFTTLTPTGSTTAVSLAADPSNATGDFGLSATLPNGLRRLGEIGRGSAATGGITQYWAWTGTTTVNTGITFSFLIAVHGIVARPTVRASLAAGAVDDPATDYPARSVTALTSSNISLSEDGNFIAYATGSGIALRNVATGAVTTIASGCTTALAPSVTTDGSLVAFQATCNLTGLGAAPTTSQIFLYDANTTAITLVSQAAAGGYTAGNAIAPRIASTGGAIAFQSTGSDLIAGQPARPAGCIEVYRYDIGSTAITHASAVANADPNTAASWVGSCSAPNYAGQAPDISGDGNLVVFQSRRALDTTDTNTLADIYAYDESSTQGAGVAVVYQLSLRSGGTSTATGSNGAVGATISSDGAFVAFNSDATNLTAGASSGRQIFMRSSSFGANSSIVRVTHTVAGATAAATIGIPQLSSDGRFVAFWSGATNLASVTGYTVAGLQVYVCDTQSPVSSLARCWVASTMEPTAAGGTFQNFSGSAGSSFRIGMAYQSSNDLGYVAYIGAPTSGTWGSMGGSGTQVLVSPVGDPRYQQVNPGP